MPFDQMRLTRTSHIRTRCTLVHIIYLLVLSTKIPKSDEIRSLVDSLWCEYMDVANAKANICCPMSTLFTSANTHAHITHRQTQHTKRGVCCIAYIIKCNRLRQVSSAHATHIKLTLFGIFRVWNLLSASWDFWLDFSYIFVRPGHDCAAAGCVCLCVSASAFSNSAEYNNANDRILGLISSTSYNI